MKQPDGSKYHEMSDQISRIYAGICLILRMYGADINLRDKMGRSPLHLAAACSTSELVGELMTRGARPNLKDKKKRSVLHYAALNMLSSVFELLASRIPRPQLAFLEPDFHGMTPLSCALLHNNMKVAEHILENSFTSLDHQDSFGRTYLHLVMFRSTRPGIIPTLTKRGCDPLKVDSQGRSCLYYLSFSKAEEMAILSSYTELMENMNPESRKQLLNMKCGSLQHTLLHRAVLRNHSHLIRRMLEHGAELQLDKNNLNPFHLAIAKGKPGLATIFADLSQPVQLAAADARKRTILHWLAAFGRRDFDKIWKNDSILNADPSIWQRENLFDVQGYTPLHLAALSGNAFAIGPLATRLKEAALELLDAKGRTPLHLASRDGTLQVVKALLDAGWDVDKRDNRQRTALMYSAEAGDAHSLHALLLKGADADARDKTQSTAVDLAAKQGHTEVLAVMVAEKKAFLPDVQEAVKKAHVGDAASEAEQLMGRVRKLVSNNATVDDILDPKESSESDSFDDDYDEPRQRHSGRSGKIQRSASSASTSSSASHDSSSAHSDSDFSSERHSDDDDDDDDDDYDNEEPRSPRELGSPPPTSAAAVRKRSLKRSNSMHHKDDDDDSDDDSLTLANYSDFVVQDTNSAAKVQAANDPSKKQQRKSNYDDDKFDDEEDDDWARDDSKASSSSDSSFENDDAEMAAALIKSRGEKGALDLSSATIMSSARPAVVQKLMQDEEDDDLDWGDMDISDKIGEPRIAVKRAGSASKLNANRRNESDDASDASESWMGDFDDAFEEVAQSSFKPAVKKASSGSLTKKASKANEQKNADEAGEESWDYDLAEAGHSISEATAPPASATQLPTMDALKMLAGGSAKFTITPDMLAQLQGGATPKHGTPPVPRKSSAPTIAAPPKKPFSISSALPKDDSDDDDDSWADDDDDDDARAAAAKQRKAALDEAEVKQTVIAPKRPPPPAPSPRGLSSGSSSSAEPSPRVQLPTAAAVSTLSEDQQLEILLSEPASTSYGVVNSSPVDMIPESRLLEMARTRENRLSNDRQLESLADAMRRKIQLVQTADKLSAEIESAARPLIPEATMAEAKQRYEELVRANISLLEASLAIRELQSAVAKSQQALIDANDARRRARFDYAQVWSEYFKQQERATERLARSITTKSGTWSGTWTQKDFFQTFLYICNGLAIFVLGFIAAITLVS